MMRITEIMKFISGTCFIFVWIFTDVVYGCDEESVYEALQACQNQREELSTASGSSFSGNEPNYNQLCLAFANYVNCMDPRIGYCNGTATSAFQIIKDTYSAHPYSCTTDITQQNKTEKPTEEISVNIPTKTTRNDYTVRDKPKPGNSSTQNIFHILSLLSIFIITLLV